MDRSKILTNLRANLDLLTCSPDTLETMTDEELKNLSKTTVKKILDRFGMRMILKMMEDIRDTTSDTYKLFKFMGTTEEIDEMINVIRNKDILSEAFDLSKL